VPALSLPRTQRATSVLLRRARHREADVVLEELEWELRPDEAIAAIGGWANGHQAGKDLYRSLALHDLGRPELVHSDYWDSLEAYESTVRNNPKAKHYAKMRPDVLWLLEHRAEVEARAADWQLLLRIGSNAAMDLQINDSDPLFVFVPRGGPDRLDRAVGRVLQG
ncbi:MAG: hypothetical protein K8H88_11185, partial [Sandaracinaceae bacterium]|nr:hypothetical protein [Sandaracinaceae bacterium]